MHKLYGFIVTIIMAPMLHGSQKDSRLTSDQNVALAEALYNHRRVTTPQQYLRPIGKAESFTTFVKQEQKLSNSQEKSDIARRNSNTSFVTPSLRPSTSSHKGGGDTALMRRTSSSTGSSMTNSTSSNPATLPGLSSSNSLAVNHFAKIGADRFKVGKAEEKPSSQVKTVKDFAKELDDDGGDIRMLGRVRNTSSLSDYIPSQQQKAASERHMRKDVSSNSKVNQQERVVCNSPGGKANLQKVLTQQERATVYQLASIEDHKSKHLDVNQKSNLDEMCQKLKDGARMKNGGAVGFEALKQLWREGKLHLVPGDEKKDIPLCMTEGDRGGLYITKEERKSCKTKAEMEELFRKKEGEALRFFVWQCLRFSGEI